MADWFESKNALNTMMMSFISLGFVGVAWALIGYTLAFSTGNDWIGDMSHLFLNGVGTGPEERCPADHPAHVVHVLTRRRSASSRRRSSRERLSSG
jgi:ammonia channel protein AmtB